MENNNYLVNYHVWRNAPTLPVLIVPSQPSFLTLTYNGMGAFIYRRTLLDQFRDNPVVEGK